MRSRQLVIVHLAIGIDFVDPEVEGRANGVRSFHGVQAASELEQDLAANGQRGQLCRKVADTQPGRLTSLHAVMTGEIVRVEIQDALQRDKAGRGHLVRHAPWLERASEAHLRELLCRLLSPGPL